MSNVYQAACDEFSDYYTGFHSTPEAALAALEEEHTSWLSTRERMRVRPYVREFDSGDQETLEIANYLADQGSPSPALGIRARV